MEMISAATEPKSFESVYMRKEKKKKKTGYQNFLLLHYTHVYPQAHKCSKKVRKANYAVRLIKRSC